MRAALLLVALCAACDGGDEGGGDTAVEEDLGCADPSETGLAVATDIDETLTTDDLEWIHQIADPDYDPEMRPDADTLMQGWSRRGYRVIYITARGEDLGLVDGTSAREATDAWLGAHDFPYSDEDVYLADGIGAFGDDAVAYKAGVLSDLAAAGLSVVYAYGNADTDIEAFQAAGIPDDHIFLVGSLAGTMGVEGIPDEDAYTAHVADFLADQPCGG